MARLRLIGALCVTVLVLAGCREAEPIPPVPAPPTQSGGDLTGEDLTVANLNVLHGHPLGADCAIGTDNCDAPGRVDVALRHVEALDCPDVVTLQEVDTRVHAVLAGAVPEICGGAYTLHLLRDDSVSLGIDQEAVLSRLPVLEERLLDLPAFPWSAHHVVLDSGLGRVDLVTTHLASGANNPVCWLADCPPHCATLDTAQVCGARVVLRYLATAVTPGGVHVVTGDLNDEPVGPVHALFIENGFADAHLVAGNPECGPDARLSCTGGGRGEPHGLYDPRALNVERIDYIMVRGAVGCPVVLDTFEDLDGDGVATGGWANLPIDPAGNAGLLWASDHSGVQADLHCAAG